MEQSQEMSEPVAEAPKVTRGRGRGSNFMVLGRDVWAKLLEVPTSNQLILIIVYLVLLAGTGSDHRLTKWSAKAVEDHVGIGKPRAKRAIEELIEAGVMARTEASKKLSPQYEMLILPEEDDPIFLPVQLVTGLSGETPILRRLREAGDPLALRMLIDLYGLIQVDPTYGVPVSLCWTKSREGESSGRKLGEAGVHAVWGLSLGGVKGAKGDWVGVHREAGEQPGHEWDSFWTRFNLLERIGAIWFEPWVFDGDAEDAEPLFPVDPAVVYGVLADDLEARVTQLALSASRALLGERVYALDRYAVDCVLPLPVHHRPPCLKGVLRMRVEPDAPGRRLAFARRQIAIERFSDAFSIIEADASEGHFDNPMKFSKLSEARP